MSGQHNSSPASEHAEMMMVLRELAASIRKQARATEQNNILTAQLLTALAESEDVEVDGDEVGQAQYLNQR